MSRQVHSIRINEDGPREGFQIESASIPTADKIELIDALTEAGLQEIQIASFVNPKKVPSMSDAEAVVAGVKMRPGVKYTALYMNPRGLERAIATGRLSIEGIGFSVCASEAFLARNENATPAMRKRRKREMIDIAGKFGVAPANSGNVSAAFGCNFQGDIGLDALMGVIESVHEFAAEYGCKIERIGLSDTMAWATPDKIRRSLDAIYNTYSGIEVSLHLHDTRGMAMANAFAGIDMGVREFDTSIGGLGGCPFAAHKGAAGNLCTEDFAFMCEEMGHQTGLDLDRLIEAARLAERIVGHPLPGKLKDGGSLSSLRKAIQAR
ncbi:hydroxymethylglutaryl-CoA lyase [Candidimonas nitroreducens]|uniref:Hydroxymethylglutaryl-CoA lyase n=1 Tax=Candidimonas nitroreducens TaxID=683354 RepID=A0A225MGA9_9BURK|nr:hydroxymethylglutaryl-CoA lyase [Candidimonas nitroreducens]OWT58960.1 hydroxymethylglutaryl-CoA lyase [Candidimonas nitroreducens]